MFKLAFIAGKLVVLGGLNVVAIGTSAVAGGIVGKVTGNTGFREGAKDVLVTYFEAYADARANKKRR